MPATVALLLPTYNEIDGFRAIFPQVDCALFDDILVVDGGSTDGTVEYAMDQGLRVMTQLRKGLGFAVMDAIATLETDCVIEFSMDGNCMVEQLPLLVQKLREGYEMVGVSRYLPPARSYDDDIVTGFGNWMFSKMIRFLGPYPVTDALNMYRGFHRRVIAFPEFEAFLRGPVFEPLVTAVSNYRRLKMLEIPGDEPARIGGVRKMRVLYNGSCILWMVLRMYLLKCGLRKLSPPAR